MLHDDIDLSYMPTLPNSSELEANVIAALFAEKDKPEVIASIMSELRPEDFYRSLNQEVFKAYAELYKAGKPIDEAFVTDRLRVNLSHIEVSGDFVANLRWQYSGGNLAEAIDALKTKAVNRALITGFYNLLSDKATVQEQGLIDKAQSLLMELSHRQATTTEALITDILPDVIRGLDDFWEGRRGLQGHSTGFNRLDGMIGGLQPTRLVTLCARTGIGKTSFALAIAAHVAKTAPVLYLSMEMSRQELAERALCQMQGLDASKLRDGNMDSSFYSRVYAAHNAFEGSKLIIDDAPQMLSRIRAKVKRAMAMHGSLGLVVVDYLGLVRSEDTKANRYEAVSSVVRGLKDIALELKIPVLCLAQPNRDVDKRGDNKLRLSDLKDSGEIEQASDLVIFLNRKNEGSEVTLEVAKQRNGPLGEIRYQFTPETTSFRECWL